jgi:hypothetical protein
MTKKVLAQIRELDTVADKSGGYVADPRLIKRDPQGEAKFSAIRNYSLRSGIPMHKLTDADYAKIGIVK